MKVDRMSAYFLAVFLACTISLCHSQYYGSQPPAGNPAVAQNQNTAAWRQWYAQQRQYAAAQAAYQKQLAAYNAARSNAAATAGTVARQPTPQVASTAATNQYAQYYQRRNQAYPQPTQQTQQRSPYQAQTQQAAQQQQYRQQQQYPQQQRYPTQQQYTQQQRPQYPQQQQRYPQQQPQQQYRPRYPTQQQQYRPPPPTAPPTTTPIPGEIEIEYEVPTTSTTTTPSPRARVRHQWGQYSHWNQPQPGGYGPQPHQQQGYSQNYYPPPQQQYQNYQPQQQPPQQQYGQQQGGWNQGPPQDAFGSNPSPGGVNDPFGDPTVNGLKPTIFNPDYKTPPPPMQQQAPQGPSDFAGIFGQMNPAPPQGKTDFGSKGPNPIQLNQFMAQPNGGGPAKDPNAVASNLDAIVNALLQGTAQQQNLQQPQHQHQPPSQPKPKPTTKAPPPSGPSMVSERLNEFVLGPQSQFRSNTFSEIPTSNHQYDSLNPLAGFIGETPKPPTTTTPEPPGRKGDFLAGFIGSSQALTEPAARTEAHPPNIYFYNYMNDSPQTTQAPRPGTGSGTPDAALSNLGTQDLSAMVQKLLGILATKQATGVQG